MDNTDALFVALDFLMHETALFAAFGFLLLGLGDLAIDLVWLAWALARRVALYRGAELPRLDISPTPM